MSLCAKPLVRDTPLRVPRSLCSPDNYILTENPSLLRSLSEKEATNFKFVNVSDRVWGCTRFLRTSNDYNFQAIHISYIVLHIFPIITSICQRFRTSRCTLLCGNITIYVKLLINCKHFSVGNSIKPSDSSGWCEYFNVPMCQTVGSWHTITRPALAALARKL